MKSNNKTAFFLVTAFTVLLSSFAIPFADVHAGISGEGEEKVKKFLYAVAAEECFKKANDSDLAPSLSVGDKISSVVLPGHLGSVKVNEILGSTEITCEAAIQGLFGSGTLVEGAFGDMGIFGGGAYSEEATAISMLECHYAIRNSEGNDFFEDPEDPGSAKRYQFPQGFVIYPGGERKDFRSVSGYTFYYNESGYLQKHDGGPADGNPRLDGDVDYYWDWYHTADQRCENLIRQLNVFPDESGYYYTIWHNEGSEYSAELDYDSSAWLAYDVPVKNNGGYSRQDGAGPKIAANIKKFYFDGKTAEEYLNSNDKNNDLAYVYYGRHLFNGDGRFPNGCGGISVAMDDEKINELKEDEYWTPTLPYITTTEAYTGSGDNRKEYLTKLGASNSKEKGENKSIKLFTWSSSTTSCTDLASTFSDIAVAGSQSAKTAVAGYIKAISAEAALSGTTPSDPSSGDPSSGDPSSGDPSSGEPGERSENHDTDCKTNTGSLGWLICPIIDGMQHFIIEQYATFVIPALQIDVGLFSTSTTGTYDAWNIFRTIANMAFVILFVIVIFSQVTGIGIDNYGIKKILPKIIIAAILINLSYIICQIAIDLANIAGRSIGTLFEGISNSLGTISSVPVNLGNGVKETVNSDTWIAGISSTGWAAILIIVVAVIGAAIVLKQGWAIVIPVLVGMIGILISLLGLICILGIRQAACVLLVAVSPLAFACYMLPNTQSIYKKWFKAFEALLIAFPICSALIYGGDMVSHILLNAANGSFWIIISAAAVSVAPIFFIPKVITGCMGAISGGMMRMSGKIGGKLGGKAKDRLEQSRLTNKRDYKRNLRAQKAAAQKSEYSAKRGRAVLKKYGDRTDLGTFERRRYNAALGAVNADEAEQEKFEAGKFANMGEEQRASALIAAANSGKLTNAQLMAGMKSIKDEGQLTRAMYEMRKSTHFQEMMKDSRMRGKVADELEGRSGSVINQSIGTLMRNGETTQAIFANNGKKLAEEVQKADEDVLARQDKTTYATTLKGEGTNPDMDLGTFASAKQMAGGVRGHLTGTAGESFNRVLSNSKQKNAIIGHLTASHFGGATEASINALGGGAHIKTINPTAVANFNSAAGAAHRANADAGVISQLS